MATTQKYKQQQQQVRILTNETNYIKGMYFTDVPLAEGYSRILLNFNIDSLAGKLTPRKGLQSLGLIHPDTRSRSFLNNSNGYNIVVRSKICAEQDTQDTRQINQYLQAILYNTDTQALLATTCAPEIDTTQPFKVEPFVVSTDAEFTAPEPFIIAEPTVHGKACVHNNFFKRPVGTFAFGNSFYTFLQQSRYVIRKITDLPNDEYTTHDGQVISNYSDLKNNSRYSVLPENQNPGNYYVFTSGESMGVIAYYNEEGQLQLWERSEEALRRERFKPAEGKSVLTYTRIGADIKNPELGLELLDKTLVKSELDDKAYYVCVANPSRLNPTEAASWGYNMLLEDPYDFVCEQTAVNLITILGILPYNKDGKIVLTPRKNEEVTLKGFYRAPMQFHSDAQIPRFYATTKRTITTDTEVTRYKQDALGFYTDIEGHKVQYGYLHAVQCYYYTTESGVQIVVQPEKLITETITISETRNPTNLTELKEYVTEPYDDYNFGDWWYLTDTKEYYMITPKDSLTAKDLTLFGTTQPTASVKLRALAEGEENEIRVLWQMRSAGAADWIELSNETFKLSEYYALYDGVQKPFTVTATMPENEVLIKLTISDISDIANGEELILTTDTIGLSLVSDELANTLNLDSKKFNLGQCTGMCEWSQRLVVWGVPGALNTLFVSDVNNPTFFPYPNNVDIFTDPIIAVHNYGDELLVLTTSALYRLTWDTQGTGWSHKLVQQNLHVTEADTYLSCVIKNMFFFKSGEYYYMMVPKNASSTAVSGEVTIAPISKPITELLDNFHKEVYNLIKVVVDQPNIADFTDKLVNYFSYVDNTKITVNYVYALDDTTSGSVAQDNLTSKYLYVQLIYDTDIRTWEMRAFEAPHMLYASHIDAIQQDRFIDITPALNDTKLVMQYYKFTGVADKAVQCESIMGMPIESTKIMRNYQYLDTGNREINTELKKRFREFQFKIKNSTATNLGFFTSFLIDGSLRKDLQRYAPRFITGDSTNEPMIVVERVLDTDTMTYHTSRIERIIVPESMLQDAGELTPTILNTVEDADKWILDQSAFPGRTFWKVRMPISGKGYTPRVILLSVNEKEFELIGHSWAYRTMHAR